MKATLKLISGVFLISVLFFGCEKDKNETGTVQFSCAIPILKSGLADSFESITNIVVTITDNNGKKVYENQKIEVLNMNGYLISKPLSLKTGSYKLCSFMLADKNNSVLYATPVAGSEKAYLVKNPLSINFAVDKDNVTKLEPEVVSSNNATPTEFGYATFSFNIVKTFDFYIGVFTFDTTEKNFKMIDADLSVLAGGKVVMSMKMPNVTRRITLPSGVGPYTLIVTKAGYKTLSNAYIESILAGYNGSADSAVLKVIMSPISLVDGLIAYYPFTGNAVDATGNGNDGIVNGATITTDRFGNAGKAFNFNGYSDYINIGSNAMISRSKTDFTVSFWMNMSAYSNSYTNCVLSNRHYSNLKCIGGSHVGVAGALVPHSGKMIFLIYGLPGEYQVSNTKSMLGQWEHHVVTYKYVGSNRNEVKLYINGVLSATGIVNDVQYIEGQASYIGFEFPGDVNQIPEYHFAGKLDELRIYNRTLSADETAALYLLDI